MKKKVVEAQTILASKITDAVRPLNIQMKKIILLIILSMLIIPGVSASEIFGQISTNPNAPAGGGNNPPAIEPVATVPVIISQTGAVILPVPNKPADQPGQSQSAEVQPIAPKQEVLGLKVYPDGSLLRGADQKIYLIQGQVKKHIISLEELKKYQGRAILKATAEELSGLESREHLDGELIRQRGDVKVYVIKQGLRQHILNLEELRAHYFGREIFNLSREQMGLY